MGKIVRQGVEYGGSSNSADCIKYNETKSVKEVIDEIKASSSNNPTASSVTFDNTDTGLNATNVQDAITEVNGKLQVFKTTLGKDTVLSPGNFALEFNTAKDGYSAMAIKSWALYNRDAAQYIHVNGVGVTDTISSITGRNSSSKNITIPSNAYIEILYAKQ